MANLERKMFEVVNRNHDCTAMALRLNAIAARRRTHKSIFNRRKTK